MQIKSCILLGDNGYLSSKQQRNPFESCQIKLEVPMRVNQDNFLPQPYIFKKSRKRIQTFFSLFYDQFMIPRNYAKSFEIYKAIILLKNNCCNNSSVHQQAYLDRNISNIKISIVKCTTAFSHLKQELLAVMRVL